MTLINLIQPRLRKSLGLVLPFLLVGGLIAASRVFLGLTREERPLPSAPVAVHHRDCLWIVDSDTDTVTHGPFCFSDIWRTVGIGDVEVTPDGYLYVSFSYEVILDQSMGQTVIKLDPGTGKKVAKIEVLYNPDQMVSRGNLLYIAADWKQVAVIDTASTTIVGAIILDLPCEAESLALSPSGELYIASCWSLASINITSGAITYNPTEFRPMIHDTALGADGTLYLLLYNEIQVVDPSTWKSVTSTGENDNLGNCWTRHIQATTGKAFVSCSKTEAIMLYDTITNKVEPISLPGLYDRIAGLSRDKLYLVSANGASVLVLNTRSNQVLTEIPLPPDK